MEAVWLRLGSGLPISVRSIRLDFLGSWLFCSESPPDVDWIVLDFLVRIETYQWVTRHKVGKYLSLAFPLTSGGAGTGACGRGHAEAQDWSWAKLTLVSDFLQTIVLASAEVASWRR
jgi:hypothetical protein